MAEIVYGAEDLNINIDSKALIVIFLPFRMLFMSRAVTNAPPVRLY
jgi:hypothetical protein